MDLTDINQALAELYQRSPHLPRPRGLAQTVRDAWNAASPTTEREPHGHTDAVIHAVWPIGAAAGAQRGHEIAATAIRDMIGEGLSATDVPNPEGTQLLALCSRVADELPAAPDTSEVATRMSAVHLWVGTGDDLDVALALGLEKGWLAGHRDGTDRLVEHFNDQITSLAGEHRLTTTFLNAELTGQDLIAGICAAAWMAAERDQTTPAPDAARVLDRARRRAPAASHAFAPLTPMSASAAAWLAAPSPPLTGPDRTNPGRPGPGGTSPGR